MGTTLENTIVLVYPDDIAVTHEQKEYLRKIIDPLIIGINIKEKIFIRYYDSPLGVSIVEYILPLLKESVFDHLYMDTHFHSEKMSQDIDEYLLLSLSANAQQVIIIPKSEFKEAGHKPFLEEYRSYANLKLYH